MSENLNEIDLNSSKVNAANQTGYVQVWRFAVGIDKDGEHED